jgi:MoaA/NifB/PqqE/SkfB family radical SAM enzyme
MKLPCLSNIGNFFPKLKPRAEGKTDRPFRAAQIEVTSRCSTGCIFCPHDVLARRWIEGDMALETYREHIVPHLDIFDLVYLQGWGEPMLHPHLWDMLEMARQKGCRTGFTTNGTWLKDDQNNKLIDMDVDLISVSFAGTAATVHESLRTHSDFSRLCTNFESLARLKKQRGAAHPWLELHFLMTRANLSEFPSLIELAASLGADEVAATNLAYSPSLALEHQHVFGEQPLHEHIDFIKHAQQTADRLNIPLRVYPLQTEPATLVCDADPLNTIYVNHRGDVGPCVYLGLAVQGEVPRYFHGEFHPFETLSFGNVWNGFTRALQSESRKRFVEAFERRNASNSPLALFTYMAGKQDEAELPPPPWPCRSCYKMLGI